jgi:hypothetical protein
MDTRLSDTPESERRHDDPELVLERQGETDWSKEERSDDLLLAGLLHRLREREA